MADIHIMKLGGEAMLTSGAPVGRPPAIGHPSDVIVAASIAAPGAWHVLTSRRALHLHLPPGSAVPADAGDSGLAWEVVRSLAASEGGAPLRASVAVASGTALDAVAVVTALGTESADYAGALAAMPLPPLEPGADAIWDRLAHVARRAQILKREGRIAAAALAFRGRGRIIGDLRGDLLIRFGVSAWR